MWRLCQGVYDDNVGSEIGWVGAPVTSRLGAFVVSRMRRVIVAVVGVTPSGSTFSPRRALAEGRLT